MILRHAYYKKEFRGHQFEEGNRVTFVEDATSLRVSLEVPTKDRATRSTTTWCENHLYNAMRGAHAKASLKKTRAARQEAMKAQLPEVPGDMGVKGKGADGRLAYTWGVLEVEVTPRSLRPLVAEGESAWKRARARETTPERALRKMTDKVKRRIDKAAKGEHERIVARAASSVPRAEGEAGVAPKADKCPALALLHDPAVLDNPRSAYEFLGTAQLHQCHNCDEEWVVFSGAWPQGGVACAGPKAGKCETIARSGYTASWRWENCCSRCASSASFRVMFSEAND